MANIPLYKYAEIEFPWTAKSTINLWAIQGFYKNRGPLADMVRRIGGRWYVQVGPADAVAKGILNRIESIVTKEKSE